MASRDVASRVGAIVENMRANAECADKQASACDTIASVAFASAATTVGRVAGAFDAIVSAMRQHEGVAKVQEQACRALGYLAWNNDANCRAIGSVAGVFDAIVGAMRRRKGVANVQAYGCFALGNLAHNDANCSAIGSVVGVFDAIVGAMRRHEGVATVQQYGGLALGNLASNDANRSAIGSVAGVFDAIVGAMRRHEGVTGVQFVACRALCQLVTCSAATATSGGFLAGLFGWLKASTEASAEVATAERNATRLATVAGVKELLQGSRRDNAARVLEAMTRAEVARRRAATAERRTADAERRAREALKRAEDEAKRADDEAKRANDEAKRADIAERRADRAEASPGPTPATARLAMVIANAEYQGHVRNLPCCARDGDAMEATLQARGFDITRHNNARSRDLHDAVDAFGRLVKANPGCIAVWYFTGHGVETEDGGANLVPVDRGLGGALLRLNALERALQESAEVRDAAAGQRPTTIIIILDCCRENENNETYKNTGGGGVARPNVRHYGFQAQYLVAHACESGTVARAQVGDAALSPFTDALVPPLREGVPLEVALKRATTVVARQTQHTQRPSYRCSLGSDDEAGAPLVL